MDLAIHYPNFTLPGAPQTTAKNLADTARAADQGGCATFTVMDHWFQMETIAGPDKPMLEGYTTLGYLAAVTERIELGLLVGGVTYRHPGLLAKIITTLDVLSEGRAMFGIGAAWYAEEHAGLGVPFPSMKERFERLEETLQIVRQMWSDDEGPYAGTHYQLERTLNNPQPVQSPRPPILIGGSGEKKTLRFVAKYADGCNLFGADPEVITHKLEVLRGHCETEGRDPATIRKSIIAFADPVKDGDGFLREMETMAGLGIDTVWLVPQAEDPAAWTAQVAETYVGKLAELG